MDKTLRLVFLAASVAVLALSVGCKKEEAKSPVLAQVGSATLTLDELRESFPAEYEQLIRREQYLDFIKRWMDDEAVYQQARKSKLEEDPAIARKLEKLRRKLLIEEFLARENSTEVFEPDEMAMNQYYEMHREEFRRKSPEYKILHIRAQTNKQAQELRSKAMRGDFLAIAAASSMDPAPESYASIAFKKLNEFPPCLSQDIDKAGVGGVTLPVACTDGFYLVKVLEKQDAGSLIPFAEAKEEISGILVLDRKDKLQEGRIATFKEGLEVSYHLDQIPGLAPDGEGQPPAAAAAVAPVESAPASPSGAPAGASTAATAPAAAPQRAAAPAASVAAAPAQTAADPRLPREPSAIPAAASAAAGAVPAVATEDRQSGYRYNKYSSRKRGTRPAAPARAAGDTSDAKAAAKPAAEPAPETPAPKPETEENADAQNPTPAP